MTRRISIFGLGLMGRPIARVLREAGYIVRGWNRSPLPAELSADIDVCTTLQAAADAGVCLLMLSDSTAVDAVLEQLDPHLQPGQLVIDMGSSDPLRSQAHAARLAERDIGWVDAPVSGGPEGAAAGSLAIMVGGTAEDVAQAWPILEALGGNVVHMGGAGAGHITKMINQLIVGLTIATVAEALILAEGCGLDPRLVQEALKGGFADSKILQLHGRRMIERSYVPGAKVTTQLKDLQLAQTNAAKLGLRLPHLEQTLDQYRQMVEQGNGELDHSAVHKLLDSTTQDKL